MTNRKEGGAFEDEERAKKVLAGYGILNHRQPCPYCGSSGTRVIRREKFRCRSCGKEWGLRKRSVLDGTRIAYRTFLDLIELYAEDVPAHDAAGRLRIAYNTVSEIYTRIAASVTAGGTDTPENGDWISRLAPSGRAGPEKSGNPVQSVVFGIRANNGTVTIETVEEPDYSVITALPIPTMQRGNILFIDAYGKRYQGFITYKNDRHGSEVIRIRARDGLPWSPLAEFWDFAGTAWKRHRGVTRERIPEFIRELEFRYNHRNRDLYPVILDRIAHHYSTGFPHDASAKIAG
jgi:transposase